MVAIDGVVQAGFGISKVAGTPRSTAKVVHRCVELSRSVGDSEAETRMQCWCRKLEPRMRFFFSRQHRLKLFYRLISPSLAAWARSGPFSIYENLRNRAERSRVGLPLTASTVVEHTRSEKGARLPCRAVRPQACAGIKLETGGGIRPFLSELKMCRRGAPPIA
jgi:hypothetical protein